MNDAPALCLDITRLTRRAGLSQPTGIDRVERAYLRHCLSRHDLPVHGLCRIGRALVVLDRTGLEGFQRCLSGAESWTAPGIAHRLSRRPPATLAAEATVLRLAAHRVRSQGQTRDLFDQLPVGCWYLNVGHSNLDPRILLGARHVGRSVVMLHDTIPLDHPDLQRKGIPASFRTKVDAIAKGADRVVVPSDAVAEAAGGLLSGNGRRPELVVAPLGVDIASSKAGASWGEDPGRPPYFVAVGTIEPRKNHRLLLDVWDEMRRTLPASRIPRLYIVGRRGWLNADVFRRLDRLPAVDPVVIELPDLDDGGLADLISGARALLCPSIAEGFGLPPHEAACLGVLPVVADLPVYRETLGDLPVYAAPDDLYQWLRIILDLANSGQTEQQAIRARMAGYSAPTWDAHFKTALTAFC